MKEGEPVLGGYIMLGKKIKIIILVCLALFTSFSLPVLSNAVAYADEGDEQAQQDEQARYDDLYQQCKDAGIIGLSFLICPLVVQAIQAGDDMFKTVQDTIVLNPKEVFAVDDSGNQIEYEAWDTFRSIANIIMVIILLVVIFSQVTGLGIDNYGIKKILPKLILAAVLLNFSYIICQLVVDFSNLIGTGAFNIFNDLAKKINTQNIDAYVTMAEVAIMALGFAATHPLMLPGIFIWILILGIVALVCIGVIYFSLSMRTMLAIVLTAISPVAFALYTLPNTKKLFQNWWKIFQSCLVIYPICAALLGASFILQSISLHAAEDNLGLKLFAMVVPVIPFLLIPKLMKSAVNGLGAIGSAIQSVTSAPKRAASKGVSLAKQSAPYKDFRSNIDRKMQEGRANAIIGRFRGKDGKIDMSKLSEGQRRKLAKAYETKDQFRKSDNAANTILTEQQYKSLPKQDLQKAWKEAFNNNSSDLAALTNVMNSNLGSGGSKYMAGVISGMGVPNDQQLKSLQTLRGVMMENSGFATNISKQADVADMVQSGGVDASGARQGLSYFTENQTIATSNSDIAAQQTSAIKRLADAGQIKPEQAKEILNDEKLLATLDNDKRNVLKAIVKGAGSKPELKFEGHEDNMFEDLAKQYDEEIRRQEIKAKGDAAKAQYKMQQSANRAQANLTEAVKELNNSLKEFHSAPSTNQPNPDAKNNTSQPT